MEAENYFISTYLPDRKKRENCLFLLNPESRVIGSCIAWQDMREDTIVSSLHWFIVDEKYQGKAICLAVMNLFAKQNGIPVYIHTQTWSWKAILLYISLGFRIQKSDTFSHYENQYEDAIKALQNVAGSEYYETIKKIVRSIERYSDESGD